MKRHVLLISILCLAIDVLGDFRVTPEEAREVASNYYQLVREDVKPEDCKAGTPETISLLGIAEMWLVPVNDSWILVSSDKRTEAILARFTTPEKPDIKSYPPAVQYLINCCEHDIEFVRDSCPDCPVRNSWKMLPKKVISQSQQTRSLPSHVDPLLGWLAWGQYGNASGLLCDCDRVYNKFCPLIETDSAKLCNRAAVGCVAVAMAQIMYYWKWPYIAKVPVTIGGDNKESHFYEWYNLPYLINNSSSLDDVNMIAKLLRDCGYSVDMSYGEESVAEYSKVVDALPDYGYDANSLVHRFKWNTAGWTNYLHTEIAEGRPVFYAGQSSAVGGDGHAFVLDGYDASGLYHVNVGLGSSLYNIFCLIDEITIGTSSYTYWQQAIWGIHPDSLTFCPPITIPSIMGMFSKWGVARAGAVTLDGVVLSSNSNWRVYSSTSIRMLPGTEVRQGAAAVFQIKDVPCSGENITNVPSLNNIEDSNSQKPGLDKVSGAIMVTPNPAREIITIHYDMPLELIMLYDLNGQLVLQTKQSWINISHLPIGIYILRATTEDGRILQEKIIHI